MYVTLFWPILTPPPLSHFVPHLVTLPKRTSHISNPQFLLVQTNGGFAGGILSGRFCLGGFCPFPLLSEYLRYNRKLNITFNFRFHMYYKKCKRVTCTCSWHLSPCHKMSHFLGPLPSSVTYFMDGFRAVRSTALSSLSTLVNLSPKILSFLSGLTPLGVFLEGSCWEKRFIND